MKSKYPFNVYDALNEDSEVDTPRRRRQEIEQDKLEIEQIQHKRKKFIEDEKDRSK